MKVDCRCPKCGTRYSIDEEKTGRKARCAKCGEKFILTRKEKNEPRHTRPDGKEKEREKKTGPVCRADPLVLKVLDMYSGQLPLEPEEKLLNFVSTEPEPSNVRTGLLLTTRRLFFFDSRQELSFPLKNIRTARVINPAVERRETLAGLTTFGHAKAPRAARLQIDDNLFCLLAPRHYLRRLINNLAMAADIKVSIQPACTQSDIVFIDETEKGITLEYPTAAPVEFPDECARCGASEAEENFHVRMHYIPYCSACCNADRGLGRKGCAVKIVKARKLLTRLLFARKEYAQNFIDLNTGMTA